MHAKILGALVAAALAVSACAGGSGTPPGSAPADESAPPSTPASGAPSQATLEITVGTDTGADLLFDPGQVNVPTHADVWMTFENRSAAPHNLTFQRPITAATSTVVAPGTSEMLRFTAPDPGGYVFVCTLHPGMRGTLTVEGG